MCRSHDITIYELYKPNINSPEVGFLRRCNNKNKPKSFSGHLH